MRRFAKLFIIIIVAGCSNVCIVNNTHVKFDNEKSVIVFQGAENLTSAMPHDALFTEINIIGDSLLLLRQSIDNLDEYDLFYKVYTLSDFSLKGDFVRKGRGPGEVLNPTSTMRNVSVPFFLIYDSMSGMYKWNVSESIRTGTTAISFAGNLPNLTMYAAPLSDTTMFMMRMYDNKMLGDVVDESAGTIYSYDLYDKDVNVSNYMHRLNCCIVLNPDKNIVAWGMLGLPIINFLEFHSGEMKSVAVDRCYKNWKAEMAEQDPRRWKRYYYDAAAGVDKIFLIYEKNHIHVFGWNGNFIYDIVVQEQLRSIDYCQKEQCLYGISDDNKIYRYNFSSLL